MKAANIRYGAPSSSATPCRPVGDRWRKQITLYARPLVSRGRPLVRQAYIFGKGGEAVVFTVKGIDPMGRSLAFACGTDEQAMEKTWELRWRCFREVVVVNDAGKKLSAAAFERSLDINWG